jgi:acetyl-CoA carboxylase biotin carboxyl carrier protein
MERDGLRIRAITLLDLEKIEKLIELMKANDLAEVSLRSGDEEINLRRPGAAPATSAPAPTLMPSPPSAPAAGSSVVESAPLPVDPEANLLRIVSPMVGTFYAASDPEVPPFVQVGSEVHPESVVCILEAMKVFNEIKAEVTGTIEKVLVKNEHAVEFGQPLFLVRPG